MFVIIIVIKLIKIIKLIIHDLWNIINTIWIFRDILPTPWVLLLHTVYYCIVLTHMILYLILFISLISLIYLILFVSLCISLYSSKTLSSYHWNFSSLKLSLKPIEHYHNVMKVFVEENYSIWFHVCFYTFLKKYCCPHLLKTSVKKYKASGN